MTNLQLEKTITTKNFKINVYPIWMDSKSFKINKKIEITWSPERPQISEYNNNEAEIAMRDELFSKLKEILFNHD